MALSSELIALLRCPESKEKLLYFPAQAGEDEFMYCPASRLKYRVESGIPIMIIEEAERLSESAGQALVARSRR